MKVGGKARKRGGTAPKVGLFGLLGQGNLGNDGSMEVVIDWLRETYPGVELSAFCSGPEELVHKWGIPAVRLHWNSTEYQTANTPYLLARKAVGKLVDAYRITAWARKHDAVIMPGMGAFEATLPLRPWGTPYSLFTLCALGRLIGCKVALVSCGANDVKDPAIRQLFVWAARQAYYLSYRDFYSQAAMRRAGLAERGDDVYPDLVFAMATPEVPEGVTNTIGVGVLDYHGSNDDRHRADALSTTYRAALKTFVEWVLDSGRDVRLFIGDNYDTVVVDELLADIQDKRPADLGRVIAEAPTDLHDLMRQMTMVDTVVATRYHNVISALKLRRPTVSVGYARKNDELVKGTSLAAYSQAADTFDVERLIAQLGELESRRDEIVEELAQRNTQNRTRLDDQFARLSRVLFPNYTPAEKPISEETGSRR